MKLKNEVTIKQTIAPATIQLLEMIQMNTVELGSYLTEQAMENPAIDLDELSAASKGGELVRRVEWLDSFAPEPAYPGTYADDDDIPDGPAASCAAAPDVRGCLESQLIHSAMDGAHKDICRYLIGCVDSRGFLSEDWDEVAQRLGTDRSVVDDCVAAMRSMQPAGICAENVGECLAAQIGDVEDADVMREIVMGYLDELARGHYGSIAKALCVPADVVRAAERSIKQLYPYPASALSGDGRSSIYVLPDVSIDGELNVTLCRRFSPHLKISSFCREVKSSTDDSAVLKYIDERIAAAGRLYKNICRCESTILSCFRQLANIQSDFFSGKTDELKPMTLADVADGAGLSVSTASRAVRDKYIKYRRGVIPAKLLFTAKIESSGGERSADEAKKLLRRVIDGEDKAAPLSDAQLSDILSRSGFDISRRTVAKYRDALGIPGTYVRKQGKLRT